MPSIRRNAGRLSPEERPFARTKAHSHVAEVFPIGVAALARSHHCLDQGEGQCQKLEPLTGGRFPRAHRRWHTALQQT